MTRADLTLFRRSRGLFWGALITTALILPLLFILALVVPAQLELYNAEAIESIGGSTQVASDTMGLLSFFAAIAAVLLGATAGAVDHQRGVLRDLVVAGKAPWRVVLGRLLAAATWLVLVTVVSLVAIIAIAVLLAPNSGSLDVEETVRNAVSIFPGLLSALFFGAGISMLIGSRGPAIGIYFAFTLIVDNLLLVIPKVGEWWENVSIAVANLQVAQWIGQTFDGSDDFDNSNAMAVVVLVAWAVIPFVLGVVRLTRRDL